MASLHLQLPDDLKAKAEHRAAESGHGNINDYVESLIRADAEADDPGAPDHLMVHSSEQLEAILVSRLDGPPSMEVTPQFRAEVQRKIKDRIDARRSGR